MGLDISKWAVAAAAKRHRQIGWLVGSAKAPPVQHASVDLLLCMFGFYCFEGFRKALKPSGKVLLVDPAPDHLLELREIIYPQVRKSPPPSIHEAQALGFTLSETRNVTFKTQPLSSEQLTRILLMTPHAHRASREGLQRLKEVNGLSLTVAVEVRVIEMPQ